MCLSDTKTQTGFKMTGTHTYTHKTPAVISLIVVCEQSKRQTGWSTCSRTHCVSNGSPPTHAHTKGVLPGWANWNVYFA